MLDVARYFGGQLRARFIQAEHDAGQVKPVVEPFVHEADRFQQFRQAVQREEVRLQREEDIVGGGQGVDREDAERGRAVDEDEVEIIGGVGKFVAEDHFAADDAGQFDFDRGQIDVRRGDPEVFFFRGRGRPGSLPEVGDGRFFGEQVVDGWTLERGSRPRWSEACACGSISMRPTRWPERASAALTFTAVVVLPTPPF